MAESNIVREVGGDTSTKYKVLTFCWARHGAQYQKGRAERTNLPQLPLPEYYIMTQVLETQALGS